MSTCHKCRRPASRTLGTQDWCHEHIEAFLEPLRRKYAPSHFGGEGIPQTAVGGEHQLLKCDQCGAGWYGPAYEHCSYCIIQREHALRYQREILLTIPDMPTDHAMYAWSKRLQVAVDADIITQNEADMIWKRALNARP